jgi:hypothetical protein
MRLQRDDPRTLGASGLIRGHAETILSGASSTLRKLKEEPMAPDKAAPRRPSRKIAEAEQFEARTEKDPLGAVQPDTDAEFTADGHIPRGQETGRHYVERIGRAGKGKPRR